MRATSVLSGFIIILSVGISIRLFAGLFYDEYGIFYYHTRSEYRERLVESVDGLKEKQLQLQQIAHDSRAVTSLRAAHSVGYLSAGEYLVEISGYTQDQLQLDPGTVIISNHQPKDLRGIFRMIAIFISAVCGLFIFFIDTLKAGFGKRNVKHAEKNHFIIQS